MAERFAASSSTQTTGLVCQCGEPLPLEVHDLFRLVAGELLVCGNCGSDVRIDIANGGEGLTALQRFCDGVREAADAGATFGGGPHPANRAGSAATGNRDPAPTAVGSRKAGPRYAVKEPGGNPFGPGSFPGSTSGNVRHPRTSNRY